MPQYSYSYPKTGLLGQIYDYYGVGLSPIDSLTVAVPTQSDQVAVGGTTDGTYTVQIIGEEGTFQFSFDASGNTADEISDGLALGAANEVALRNIVDTSATSGTPLALDFLQPGYAYEVSFPSNPGGHLSLSPQSSAIGLPIGLGKGVAATASGLARPFTGADTAQNFRGIVTRNAELVQFLPAAGQPLAGASETLYLPGDQLSVARSCAVWVDAEAAVSVDDPVFCRAIATGTELNGALRNDADGGDAFQVAGRWLTATTGPGQRALVLINTP